MKKWLKQQTTEFTAWTGAALIALYFFGPHWAFFWAGVALIAIDDKKAEAYAKDLALWAQKKIDQAA